MANYVVKEMPAGMGNGKKGRIFPKMQVYTEFDYDKVVDLIHTNSPAFSQTTIRGVSTASVAAQPPGNSPNSSPTPIQASKPKEPARIRSGCRVLNNNPDILLANRKTFSMFRCLDV